MNLNFTLILQIISFLVLLGLLTKFLYKPFVKYLDERTSSMQNLIEGAEKDRKEAEKLLTESKEELKRTKEEVLFLKETAIHESDKEKLKTVENAKKEAISILNKAELEIKKEIIKAKEEAKKDIAELSLEIAEKILGREINKKDHDKIVKQSLKDIKHER